MVFTDHLYGGDTNYRLQQEIVLGMGGLRMANALGRHVNVYHMNEGHAALLTLALLESQLGGGPLGAATDADLAIVRSKCVFTTHTPVPAGHDRFSTEQATAYWARNAPRACRSSGPFHEGMLNMTMLALRFSRYANGVALQHGKVSREMFPEFPIDSITNGVHAPTWVSEPVQQMLDAEIPSWRRDNLFLRNAIEIPIEKIRSAHAAPKKPSWRRSPPYGIRLDPEVLTLGFARRVATYKRASLMFTDPERLVRLPSRPADCKSSMRARPTPRTSLARH